MSSLCSDGDCIGFQDGSVYSLSGRGNNGLVCESLDEVNDMS